MVAETRISRPVPEVDAVESRPSQAPAGIESRSGRQRPGRQIAPADQRQRFRWSPGPRRHRLVSLPVRRREPRQNREPPRARARPRTGACEAGGGPATGRFEARLPPTRFRRCIRPAEHRAGGTARRRGCAWTVVGVRRRGEAGARGGDAGGGDGTEGHQEDLVHPADGGDETARCRAGRGPAEADVELLLHAGGPNQEVAKGSSGCRREVAIVDHRHVPVSRHTAQAASASARCGPRSRWREACHRSITTQDRDDDGPPPQQPARTPGVNLPTRVRAGRQHGLGRQQTGVRSPERTKKTSTPVKPPGTRRRPR